MNWLKFTLWTYLVFALHSSLATGLAVAGFAPHLVLAGSVLLASRTKARQGLLLGALWGFLADCLTDGRMGAGVICFSLSTWALQICTSQPKSTVPWRLAVLSLPLVWVNMIGTELLRGLTDGRPVDLQGLCPHAAGSAIYTVIIIAMAEWAIRLVHGKSPADAVIAAPTVSNKWRMLTE
jgi:rod shape-determining protein MreD